jgi:hypothetical protein
MIVSGMVDLLAEKVAGHQVTVSSVQRRAGECET